MPAMLDVIFSMFLGLTIVFLILNANVVVNEGWHQYQGEVLVQQMLISTATLLEGEFRNMGYRVPKEQGTNTGIILGIGVDSIRFASDINNDGVVNEVKYYLGNPADVDVQNDSIRILYRQVDGAVPRGVGYVTHLQLRYFTREGIEVDPDDVMGTPLGDIHLIEIELEVQNPYALYREPGDVQPGERDALYSSSRWRQIRLGSKNFGVRGSSN